MAAPVVADGGDRVGSEEAAVCFSRCRYSIKFIYAGLYGSQLVLLCSYQWILALLLLFLMLSVAVGVAGRKRSYSSYPLM